MFHLLDFVYDNCLFRQFKVNDLLFVEYKCVADELLLKVWSEHNYIIYGISGKKVWQTVQGRYELESGEALFVKKGANIVHQFFDRDFCSLIIFVPDHYIVETIRNCPLAVSMNGGTGQLGDTVIPLQVTPVAETYFHSVCAFFLEKQEPLKELLEIKFRELVLYLLSSPENHLVAAYFRSLCCPQKQRIRELMESHFIYNMKLETFAQLSGRSLAAFKRDFQEIYHTSPGRWLMEKKLGYARHLLEVTDKNINELSFDCGFENSSHFIRNFRKHFGTTPYQLKRRLRHELL